MDGNPGAFAWVGNAKADPYGMTTKEQTTTQEQATTKATAFATATATERKTTTAIEKSSNDCDFPCFEGYRVCR